MALRRFDAGKLDARDHVIIVASVSNEDAAEKFPKGFTEHKPYLRTTPDPS